MLNKGTTNGAWITDSGGSKNEKWSGLKSFILI